MELLNLWLIELCTAGVLPDGWMLQIVTVINTLSVLLGFGPQAWG